MSLVSEVNGPENGSLVSHAPPELPDDLREYLPVAEANALRNAQACGTLAGAALKQHLGLLAAVSSPSTPKASRVMMLRHIASDWSTVLTSHAACKSGCSHCCHIAVTIPETEARLIAKRVGRKLQKPLSPRQIEDGPDIEHAYGYDTPCVFLEQGRCSIYENRPMACRTLVNLDDSERLCELLPGVSVPVPYANATQLEGRFALTCQSDTFADIRDWFRH